MMRNFVLTSESVTEGHPDKLCDRISDAVVDRFLTFDPMAQVSAECAVATGAVFLAVQFAAGTRVDVAAVAREVIGEIGYADPAFNAENVSVLARLAELPPAARTDERELDDAALERIPADNIVTVFGHACRQSPSLLPLPIWLAHRLARRLAEVRRSGVLRELSPDGKTQVGVEFRDRRPVRIDSVTLVAGTGAKRGADAEALRAELLAQVVEPVFARESLRPDAATRLFINPAGAFEGGGPGQHAGLTGRKTGIDTYGEFSRHSGSALSGKDPARIDRIAAYAARHAAKNVVAAGLADECEVQLSYTLGLSRPVSIEVDSFSAGALPDEEIGRRIRQAFDFRPAAIIARMGLRHLPSARGGRFYQELAAYGHMGRTDLEVPWEALDAVDALGGG